MLPTSENSTFCRGLYGETDGCQYRENGARHIYSNYNQMRAYVECSPNQSKSHTLSTFPSRNRNFENSGTVLAVSVSQFYQSIAVQF